jgi:hypothetical protein
MQYVSVKFEPWDRKTYTYHWTGPVPLQVGQEVVVQTAKGDAIVTVETLFDKAPPFETKPILCVYVSPEVASVKG